MDIWEPIYFHIFTIELWKYVVSELLTGIQMKNARKLQFQALYTAIANAIVTWWS